MKLKLITIGATTDDYLKEGLMDYERRLSHYCNYVREELRMPKNSAKLTKEELLEKESQAIQAALSPSDFLVLLDENGKMYSSTKWANYIQQRQNAGTKRMVFVIGGPYGFSKHLKERADGLLSLSSMTLTHQMVRLLFTEQLYRAFTIIKGEKYHHE